MKVALVRHGETEWNKLGKFLGQLDIGLNPRGLAQARETALAMAEWGHTVVYASPLARTMQVAQEISMLDEVPVVPVEGVKELDLGDAEGITGERDALPLARRLRCLAGESCHGGDAQW